MTDEENERDGIGYYLRHCKETCLVGLKGNIPSIEGLHLAKDVILSKRQGHSEKPHEIYDIIETLVPNGAYLELFGRKNNLRNKWVTIGNEI